MPAPKNTHLFQKSWLRAIGRGLFWGVLLAFIINWTEITLSLANEPIVTQIVSSAEPIQTRYYSFPALVWLALLTTFPPLLFGGWLGSNVGLIWGTIDWVLAGLPVGSLRRWGMAGVISGLITGIQIMGWQLLGANSSWSLPLLIGGIALGFFKEMVWAEWAEWVYQWAADSRWTTHGRSLRRPLLLGWFLTSLLLLYFSQIGADLDPNQLGNTVGLSTPSPETIYLHIDMPVNPGYTHLHAATTGETAGYLFYFADPERPETSQRVYLTYPADKLQQVCPECSAAN